MASLYVLQRYNIPLRNPNCINTCLTFSCSGFMPKPSEVIAPSVLEVISRCATWKLLRFAQELSRFALEVIALRAEVIALCAGSYCALRRSYRALPWKLLRFAQELLLHADYPQSIVGAYFALQTFLHKFLIPPM